MFIIETPCSSLRHHLIGDVFCAGCWLLKANHSFSLLSGSFCTQGQLLPFPSPGLLLCGRSHGLSERHRLDSWKQGKDKGSAAQRGGRLGKKVCRSHGCDWNLRLYMYTEIEELYQHTYSRIWFENDMITESPVFIIVSIKSDESPSRYVKVALPSAPRTQDLHGNCQWSHGYSSSDFVIWIWSIGVFKK